MDETIVKKKARRRFFDNIFVVIIMAVLLINGGVLLGEGIAILAERLVRLVNADVIYSDAWMSGRLYLGFTGIWVLFLATMCLGKTGRKLIGCAFGKVKGNNIKMLGVGLLIGLGMNLFCAFVAMLNGDIHLRFDSFRLLPFLWLFVVVFIQSAAEELICRCYVYQKIIKRYNNVILAVVINALLFSLLHMGNNGVTYLALLNIFLYGLLFSAMVYYMDSLWAAFAAHAAWNFNQNIILGLPNSGFVSPYSVFKLDASTATNSFAYDVGFGVESTVVASVILAVVALAIMLWGRKNGKKPTNVWADEAPLMQQ